MTSGTDTTSPTSITQPSVDHDPMSRALRAEPSRVVAHRTAVTSPPTIAITEPQVSPIRRGPSLPPHQPARSDAIVADATWARFEAQVPRDPRSAGICLSTTDARGGANRPVLPGGNDGV